jgi:hypothetical protein
MMFGFRRVPRASVALCLITVFTCSISSAALAPQGLTVVSVTAVKPYSPVTFTVTGLLSGKTVRRASVAAFDVTLRNASASHLSHIRITLVVDQPHLAPLVKTQTLAAIGPKGTSTVSFQRFHGAVFAEKTKLTIALGSEPAEVYAVSVPWA